MDVPERLKFLAETAQAEVRQLRATDARLFAQAMTPQRAAVLRTDIDLSERADAFSAQFARLQDTLGDKLLPALLQWLAEPVGAAIDNLHRAERLGWVASTEDWLVLRRLRNRMVHEYVRDDAELAQALNMAHAAVAALDAAATAMVARITQGQ